MTTYKNYFNENGQQTNEKGDVIMKNANNEVTVLNMDFIQSLEQQSLMSMQLINGMKEMFISMQNMTDEVGHMKEDMNMMKTDIVDLHKEVLDNVYLSASQYDEITQLLKDATVSTVNSLYGFDLEYNQFNKAYRRVVMRFWSLLKKHCDNVSRGREIKRKDYKKAKDFASSLGVSSFVLSFGKNGIPSL